MILRTPVTRVPIKLRKPIHRDFCKCWGVQTFAIEGVPQFINGDNSFTSAEQLIDFLDSTPVCLPIHFTYEDDSVGILIGLATSRKVPVVVKTNRVLPDYILDELRKVPHSGIQVSINFLDDLMRNRLEEGASDIFSLRQMLFLAKSWKIFTGLHVDYQPHLVSKLDLYEIITMVKNCVSHMEITFPDLSDELFYEMKSRWESLKTSSVEKFKQYYIADVPTRTWTVRSRFKEELLSGLVEYLKDKKVSIEVMEHHKKYMHGSLEDRVRHMTSGLSNLPFGIRPFFYEKDEDVFKEVESVEGCSCQKCGKPIFA